jgi:hypothetical protein
MIPETYREFVDEALYLTEKDKMKWNKASDETFTYRSEDVTLTITYFVDHDSETSYYSFRYSSPRNNISDGFRVANYDNDFSKMEELYGSASRSAQSIDKKLTNLLTQIKTNTILSKIKEGEARNVILRKGGTMSVGFIRVENDEVVFYTGKALREIFKPNMNEEERKKSAELRKLGEEELIEKEYIDRLKINEIKDVV